MNHKYIKEAKLLKFFPQKLSDWQTNILLFLIVAFVIGFLQYLLLGVILNYGFTPDDWGLLFFYKTLGNDPFSKILYVWSIKGAYTTGPIYFIGVLNHFFGLNYSAYQITNITLKSLATFSVYPLILVVFKRKLLAFLTTILYSFSYMASRSLEYVVKGTDYLAIIPMNLFLIVYYYIVKEKLTNLRWFFLMSFFWFISLMISPIRIYPMLVLIPLIELFLWVQKKSKKNALNSFKRLLVLYLPFLIIYLYKPSSILAFLQSPQVIYHAIVAGNWHLILTPFQGVGLTLVITDYWNRVFGDVNLESFSNYVSFLLGGPLVIFASFAAFISAFSFRKRLKAFASILCITLIFSMAYFFIVNHLYNQAEIGFDPNRIYPSLIGAFMLAVSFASFLEWRSLKKEDNLRLALWISSPIILLYTFLIWVLAPLRTGFEGQQGYYLVVPVIATSLFLASILVAIYDKTRDTKRKFKKMVLPIILLVCLIFLFLTNSLNTYYYYNSAGKSGRSALDQDRRYSEVMSHQINFNYNEPILFYFDISENTERNTYYYEEVLFHSLPIRILLRNERLHNGCIGIFYRGIENLTKLVSVKTDEKGFIYQGQCVKEGIESNRAEVFFKVDNLQAFKIKGLEIIDIKKDVLEKVGFK